MPAHDLEILHKLRERARRRWSHPPKAADAMSLGQRCADVVATAVGSWRFIILQSGILVGWLIWNMVSGARFDPYPFILLNLALSFQAAYSAPIIMMSQNRQSDIDRRRSIEDYEVNQKAELEIETLHQKIDLLKEQEIARLTEAVAKLSDLLEKRI